jgi:hypothetical protein
MMQGSTYVTHCFSTEALEFNKMDSTAENKQKCSSSYVLAKTFVVNDTAKVSCRYWSFTQQNPCQPSSTFPELRSLFLALRRIPHFSHSHSTGLSPSLKFQHNALYIMAVIMVEIKMLHPALRVLQLIFAITVMGTDGYGTENECKLRYRRTVESDPII